MLLYDLYFCYLCADPVLTSVSSFQIPKCITNFWPSRINDLLHHHNNLEFRNFTALTAFQLITKLNFDNASKLYLLTKSATTCYMRDQYYYYFKILFYSKCYWAAISSISYALRYLSLHAYISSTATPSANY